MSVLIVSLLLQLIIFPRDQTCLQVSRSHTQNTEGVACSSDVSELRSALKDVSNGLKHLETSKADCSALDARFDSFRKAVEDMKSSVVCSMAEERAARSGKMQQV